MCKNLWNLKSICTRWGKLFWLKEIYLILQVQLYQAFSPARDELTIGPNSLGPVAGREEWCGRMLLDAPLSTRNRLFETWSRRWISCLVATVLSRPGDLVSQSDQLQGASHLLAFAPKTKRLKQRHDPILACSECEAVCKTCWLLPLDSFFFDQHWLAPNCAVLCYTVKRVDELVRHPHLVTQDQFTQVSKKVSDIPEENFTINIELFRHFSQVSN